MPVRTGPADGAAYMHRTALYAALVGRPYEKRFAMDELTVMVLSVEGVRRFIRTWAGRGCYRACGGSTV